VSEGGAGGRRWIRSWAICLSEGDIATNGEFEMKKTFLAASAVALLASVGVANAAEATGRITLIDEADHMITLSNGQHYTYVADPGEPNVVSILDGFRVGEKVRVEHNGGSATGITPLN
jgi:hypothetical protein